MAVSTSSVLKSQRFSRAVLPMPEASRKDHDIKFGLIASVAGHFLILLILLVKLGQSEISFPQPVVYSITLEGGKNIGGISQVGQKTSSPVAPPKNTSSPEKTEPVKKVETTPEKVVDPKETADPDEVSLVDKVLNKPPEVKKPQPKESSKPTPEPTKKVAPTPKATPKPEAAKSPSAKDLDRDYQKAMQRYTGESTEAAGKGFGAAVLGGNGMGGGVIRPPEFFTYRDLLRSHVKHEWRWYDSSSKLTAQVQFSILPDGAIRDAKISRSSGSREFDDSIVRAVIKADPAPLPPASVYEFFKSVTITFDAQDR